MPENEEEKDMTEDSGPMNQDDITKMIEEMQNAAPEPGAADAASVAADLSTDSVNVNEVQLNSLLPDGTNLGGVNFNLLMNLSLSVSIELGRTEMMIRDILKLGLGSIVELNKVAGEPIDLLVNNKKFAEGEVVEFHQINRAIVQSTARVRAVGELYGKFEQLERDALRWLNGKIADKKLEANRHRETYPDSDSRKAYATQQTKDEQERYDGIHAIVEMIHIERQDLWDSRKKYEIISKNLQAEAYAGR